MLFWSTHIVTCITFCEQNFNLPRVACEQMENQIATLRIYVLIYWRLDVQVIQLNFSKW